MEVDKTFCMSSYLMYRYNYDVNKAFSKKPSNIVDITFPRIPVKSPEDLISAIEQSIENANKNGRLALALSGGIDSAILAKFTPKGTKAYTFRCIVKGKKVIDETERARHWAEICGLEHTIIDITWEEIYKKANFNKIQFDENIYQNTLSSKMLSTKEINFEDYITGIYKEKYIILISDFQELTITRRNFYRKIRHITNEGIFCVMKMDKNILNSIRITNDKKNSFSIEKQYVVTTMPEKFYKNFIILAKDGYKISEKISDKSIEIIKNFYDKSKIKFDISIINDEIFFKFKTIDSMELNRWRNVVDDLMLKEYANIIMFVIKLSEEINNNWK